MPIINILWFLMWLSGPTSIPGINRTTASFIAQFEKDTPPVVMSELRRGR